MSTKQQTTGTNNTSFQFAPGSQAMWSQNASQWLPFARSLFQNPFGNQMFQQENTMGQDQAASVGARNKSNIVNNAAALGYGTQGALFNSMMQRAGRDTSSLQAQAFRGAVGNANQRAMTGLGLASSFQPLMTGSNSNFNQTQTTSGLGTWLPQLAGAAIGAGMGAFGGMASGASSAGSAGKAVGGGVSGMASGMSAFGSGLGNLTGGGYGYGSTSGVPPSYFMGH